MANSRFVLCCRNWDGGSYKYMYLILFSEFDPLKPLWFYRSPRASRFFKVFSSLLIVISNRPSFPHDSAYVNTKKPFHIDPVILFQCFLVTSPLCFELFVLDNKLLHALFTSCHFNVTQFRVPAIISLFSFNYALGTAIDQT